MPAELPTRIEVSPEAAGARLDAFLADAAGSRAAAQGLIEDGLVLVNGRRARIHTRCS